MTMTAAEVLPGTKVPRRLSVMMVGLRGCPNVQGGVERHVEQLAPRLAAAGCDVEVLVRAPYVPAEAEGLWQGVRITRVWCWRSRSLEAIVQTFLGVLTAAWKRPDVLHIQAIGPALFVPMARLLGLRVVVTHHGFDYERDKWGRVGKTTLQIGERLGMGFAHARIVISRAIAGSVSERLGARSHIIPNGVTLPQPCSTKAALGRLGLEPARYVLTVGRIVPEKRHLDLIAGFKEARLDGWKLVIVGAPDHPDDYSRSVERRAAESENCVLAGFQTGTALSELFANAGVFVLPSSHEGLPIALLEALANGLPSIASDIPPNREVGLPDACYFPLGDIAALSQLLKSMAAVPSGEAEREERRRYVKERFDWDLVARRTLEVYRMLMR